MPTPITITLSSINITARKLVFSAGLSQNANYSGVDITVPPTMRLSSSSGQESINQLVLTRD